MTIEQRLKVGDYFVYIYGENDLDSENSKTTDPGPQHTYKTQETTKSLGKRFRLSSIIVKFLD